jgi:hypothetical protein
LRRAIDADDRMAPLQRKYDDSFPDSPVTTGDCDFHEVVRRQIYEGSRKGRLSQSYAVGISSLYLRYIDFVE